MKLNPACKFYHLKCHCQDICSPLESVKTGFYCIDSHGAETLQLQYENIK